MSIVESKISNLFLRRGWFFVQICMFDNLFSTQIWHEWKETFLFMAPFKDTTIVLLPFGTPSCPAGFVGKFDQYLPASKLIKIHLNPFYHIDCK